MNDSELYVLAETVGTVLRERGARLVTAESCTGGWVAQALTEVPGSSEWFDCGFITYSNRAKRELLGVSEAILNQQGAVSEEAVRAMATGALQRADADLAVAISGIAGPSGGTPGKPVGTVWIAWVSATGFSLVSRSVLLGDRRDIRRQAVRLALRGIVDGDWR
jgi:nicotinamide-nucleotide amidase